MFGYDSTGKPALYMIPSRQNTTEAPRQIDYAVWMLERTIDLMEPGVESVILFKIKMEQEQDDAKSKHLSDRNLALLINFADRGKNPSISTALSVLHILQNHYPERLGLALIVNIPFLVNAFFKIVMPLVDPITRQKVKFNPEIFKDGFFKEDNVMKEWGGSVNFEYNHEKYWADLNKQCDERTKAWFESWKRLGASVGLSEWAYKQGAKFVSPTETKEIKEPVLSAPEPQAKQAETEAVEAKKEAVAQNEVDSSAQDVKKEDTSAAQGTATSIVAAAGTDAVAGGVAHAVASESVVDDGGAAAE